MKTTQLEVEISLESNCENFAGFSARMRFSVKAAECSFLRNVDIKGMDVAGNTLQETVHSWLLISPVSRSVKAEF